MDIKYWEWAVEHQVEYLNSAMAENNLPYGKPYSLEHVADCAKQLVSAGKELLFHQSVDLSKTGKLIQSYPWGMLRKAINVVCPDGKRRTVQTAMCADTFFSIPAKVRFKGKTVSGFITSLDREDGEIDYQFVPSRNGKNFYLFEQYR